MKKEDKKIGVWSTPGGNYPTTYSQQMQDLRKSFKGVRIAVSNSFTNWLDGCITLFKIIVAFAVVIFIISLFTSCISQKRVDKICQTCAPDSIVFKTDSIYIERIDTVYRVSAWDSLLLVSTWNPDKITDTIIIEDTHWKGQFYISQGQFKAHISYLKDSITQIVKTIEKTSNNSVEKIIHVDKPVNIPIRDKRFKFYRAFTWIAWIAVILFLGLWIWLQYQKGKITWLSKFKM